MVYYIYGLLYLWPLPSVSNTSSLKQIQSHASMHHHLKSRL